MTCCALAWALLVSPVGAQMVIDGKFDDWRMQPFLEEPLADGQGTLELGTLQWRLDTHGLWISFSLNEARNLQAMEHTLAVILDTDPEAGQSYFGLPGADRVVEFSPPRDPYPMGVAVLTDDGGKWRQGDASVVDLRSSPTFADKRFEMRTDFEPALVGGRFRLALRKGDFLVDQTDPVTLQVSTDMVDPVKPLPWRPGETDLRVMAWNVGGDSIRENLQSLRQMLQAIKPDAVLLDEVPEGVDFSPVFDGSWHMAYGSSGGARQRGVIAARSPLTPAPAFEIVAYPDGADDLVRTRGTRFMKRDLRRAGQEGISAAGALLRIQGNHVLLVALDFQCCGRLGSVQDDMRKFQAEGIRRAIKATQREFSVQHAVVGGDLNLVGSRRPLEILSDGSGPEGGDLKIVETLQPDGLANVTWYRDGDIFPPGRLDFVLHSPGLERLNSWVLDSDLMNAETRRQLGLAAGVEKSSDHRPIIADFSFSR